MSLTKKIKINIIDIIGVILAVLLLAFAIIFVPSLYEGDKEFASASSKNKNLSTWQPEAYKYLENFENYFSKDVQWVSAMTGAGRQVDFLVSVPLYLKQGAEGVIDFAKADTIHPPVENSWFVQHELNWKLDTILEQDTDADGFSNIEEYQGGTDPNSDQSFPELIAKLELVQVNVLPWQLKFSSYAAGKAWFSYMDIEGKVLNRTRSGIAAGEDFFNQGEINLKRFKLLDIQEGVEVETRPGQTTKTQMATIQDLSPFAQGITYQVPRTLPRDPELLKQYQFEDLTAEVRLNALNQESNTITVKVNDEFTLPFNTESKKVNYKVTDLTFNSDLGFYELEVGWLESGEQKIKRITL
mgnify:CR=1 FL=1